MLSRRPIATHNRGRVASALAGGDPPPVTEFVTFSSIENGDTLHCHVEYTISFTCSGCTSVEVFWDKGGGPVSIGVDNSVGGGSGSVTKTFVDTYGASEAGFSGAFTAVGTLSGGGTINATAVTATVYSPALDAVTIYIDYMATDGVTLDGSNNITAFVNKKTGGTGGSFGNPLPTRTTTAVGGTHPGALFTGTQSIGSAAGDATAVNVADGSNPALRFFVALSVSPNPPSTSRNIFSFGNSGSASGNQCTLVHTSAGNFALTRRDSGGTATTWDPLPCPDTGTHVIEAQMDGTGTVRMRIDGGDEVSETFSAVTIDANRYVFGRAGGTSAGSFLLAGVALLVVGDVDDAAAARIREHLGVRCNVDVSTLSDLDGFSGFTSNALGQSLANGVAFRQSPAASYIDGSTDYQVACYINHQDELCLARRVYGSSSWTHQVTAFNQLTMPLASGSPDGHNCAVIAIDGSGYIHAWGGMHNHPIRYTRSATPYDLNLPRPLGDPLDAPATTWQPMIAGQSSIMDDVTYPEVSRFSNGDLILRYRDGASGAGNTHVLRLSHATQTWSVVCQLVTGGDYSVYWHRMWIDSQDRVHMVGSWRGDGAGGYGSNTQHDLFYVMSAANPTSGSTWYTTPAGSTPQTLPITHSNCTTILATISDHGPFEVGGLTCDSNDYPILATSMCFESTPGAHASHDTDYFVMAWNGSTWTGPHRVGGLATNAFHNDNDAASFIPPPLLVYEDATDTVHIFACPDLGGRIGLHRASASRSDLTSWSAWDPVYPRTLGLFAPSIDESRLKRDGTVSLYVQKVDPAFIPAQTAGMLEIDLT